MANQLVWLKRDLRVHDHTALHDASLHGAVLPLYILEPDLWQQPDMSWRHYQFLCECLKELQAKFEQLGQPLIIRVGKAEEVIPELIAKHDIKAVWSHQETWNGWTYARDLRVKKALQELCVPWHEPVQNGVIRGLKSRYGWANKWYGYMSQPCLPPPAALAPFPETVHTDALPSAEALGLPHDGATEIQTGGRKAGIQLLQTFLHDRGEFYTKAMSSPVTAFDGCSRLSPHLAFGTLSMREVFQATERRNATLHAQPPALRGKWPSAVRSFGGRLRWHCHFMQKLEDASRMEFENMHSAYNGLRENNFNEAYFVAWKNGQTGYPLIDACMRALKATGYLNFRMRAMVTSFASYHLWLHWRETSLYLARQFTDYEPGIHYSQIQMQSGTTGINSIRIYNPIKQSQDQDPEGFFIRQWVPELAHLTNDELHTPWQFPEKLNGYPLPVVNEPEARKSAAAQLYGIRKSVSHRQESQAIVAKHGSRKSGLPKGSKRQKKTKVAGDAQAKLPL